MKTDCVNNINSNTSTCIISIKHIKQLRAWYSGSKHERGIDRWVKMSDQSTSEHSTLGPDHSTLGPEVSGVYDLPFVTKYIKRVRACQYFPISPSFVNCGTSCLRTSHEETDGCKLTEENGLLPLQKEVWRIWHLCFTLEGAVGTQFFTM